LAKCEKHVDIEFDLDVAINEVTGDYVMCRNVSNNRLKSLNCQLLEAAATELRVM